MVVDLRKAVVRQAESLSHVLERTAALLVWQVVSLPCVRRALMISLFLSILVASTITAAPAYAQAPPPICFWSDYGPLCVERAGVEGDPEALLTALLTGPTLQERIQGLRSVIPPGTLLDGVEVHPDGTVIVRLVVPFNALLGLDHGTFEAIVQQLALTLEPVGWRDLRIQTWDPIAGEFVPLAAFLPKIPPPRKEKALAEEVPLGVSAAEEGEVVRPAYVGQPPAPGQAQPQGALSGKTIYVSAGHGWEWEYDGRCRCYRWKTQRPPYPLPPYEGPIIEDHNNAEAVNQYLLQYLWNAGATVIPVRERDMNPAEGIVDNDAPGPDGGYFETGVWTTTLASGTGYAGTDYRWTKTTGGSPTATAVWTATLPTDGEYAVYVWYRQGTNRARDARYTIYHAGGQTEVVVDQQVHGNTWHYLGTYGFQGGEVATVTLSNLSAYPGTVVVADAVRFGGGTFDEEDLGSIQTSAEVPPDKPWWEVAAFYYVQRMGMDPGDWPYFNDVVARPMYARWEHAGTGDDAVYISWHTNGYSGYQWDYSGTVSYIHNGEGNPVTPGSADLRHAVHTELVHDIRAGRDPDWVDQGERALNLGELRELWDDDPTVQMPGTLIEIAYHDHPDDTDALKEPTFEMLVARAIYQGIVKYFAQRDGVSLPLLPEPPTHLTVRNVGGGQVRISWHPSPTDTMGVVGNAATGYRVYISTDGVGWSNGISVGNTTVYTLTGLSPGQLLFIRVTAVNDGGESFPTETLAVRVGNGAGVLLVNGFDRLNSTMLVEDYDPVEGYNLRMLLDQMNTYDYAIQHGEVISYPFDSASNEAVRDGDVVLTDYAVVDWILGEESAPDQTLDPTERDRLRAFLDGGGALFISGTEVGWHLDDQGADPAFYNGYLRADYVADDAGTYEVEPVMGSIFEGLSRFRFDAAGMYDADYPDVIAPANGSTAALSYYRDGALVGTAGVQYQDGTNPCQRLVHLGFPFETIHPDDRDDVMGRVMGFLDECLPMEANTRIDTPADGSAHNTVPPFGGTAEAGGTAALDRVEVQVRRETDGLYWTGTAWSTTETWLTATGTVSWTYPLTMPLTDGDYRLRARAWTADGAVDTSPAIVLFTYDTAPPTSTSLITPTNGITVPAVPGISLEWESVAPDGGSPLAYRVKLDDEVYTTTQSIYTVTHIADGVHVWGVQVFDAAGNPSSWVTDTFTVRREHVWLPIVLRDFRPPESPPDLVNGSFETDEGWTLNHLATYDASIAHAGARSARVGILPGEPGAYIYSSISQIFQVPAIPTATLSLWVYPLSEGDLGDQYYVSLYDQDDQYHSLGVWHPGEMADGAWGCVEYDLGPYQGQVVTLYIGVKNDGDDDTAAMYVDDVALEVCP